MAASQWIPSKHPRDKFGRFTRSRSVQATASERQQAAAVASGLKPKRGAKGAYLQSAAGTQHRETVAAYTSGEYIDIHKALRAGNTSNPQVQAMDAAMVELPDDLIVSRRVPTSQFGSLDVDDLVGLKVKDAAYSPTSVGAVRATKGDVRLRIAVPKGTRAAINPDTGEIILDRDLEMVVANVDKNPAGSVDVFLTVLPKAGASKPSKPRKAGNEPDTDGTPEGGSEVRADLMKRRVPELQAMMRERGLKPGRLRKSQLVDALVADEIGSPAGDTGSPPDPQGQLLNAVRDVLTEKGRDSGSLAHLSDVRARLTGMSRQQQDDLLLQMDRERSIHLDPDPARLDLTDQQIDAAILVGSELKHLISVPRLDRDNPEPTSPQTDLGASPGPQPLDRSLAMASDLPAADGDTYRERLASSEQGRRALGSAPQGLNRENTLSPEQVEALAAYQDTFDGHFERINTALRAADRTDSTVADMVADIDDAMVRSRLTTDVVSYRGVKDARSMFGDRIDGDLTGMVWREDAYVSTSASEKETSRFSSVASPSPVRMRILTPAGVEAIDLSPAGSQEQELLLRRGLILRVVADKGSLGGVRRLDVEVLPPEVQQ